MAQALVAQLDRASDFDSEGRRFESFRARHFRFGKMACQDRALATARPNGSFIPLSQAPQSPYSRRGSLHRLVVGPNKTLNQLCRPRVAPVVTFGRSKRLHIRWGDVFADEPF